MGEYIPNFGALPVWPESLPAQDEYVVLLWTLLLNRGTVSSDSGRFAWKVHDAWTSASLSELVSAEYLSDIVDRIRKLLPTSSSSSSSLSSMRFTTLDPTDSPTSSSFSLDVQLHAGSLHLQPIFTSLEASHPVSSALPAVVADLLDIISSPSATLAQTLAPGPRELDYLWAWNTPCPPAIERNIHEIISEQIDVDPSRPAVVSWDGQLSYAQLDTLSTQLAHDIVSRGVKVGQPVPLCFEKSRWTIVGVLAVIKAGGCLVLMDPSQPEGRLATITAEVKAGLMLTSEAQAELGRRLVDEVVVVGLQLESTPSSFPSALEVTIPSSSPLYLQFTSGSTGKPKGVVITHVNYTSGAIPRAAAVGYTRQSRVLDFPSYAFDVSVDCMLCTLASGGCICVPSEDSRVNDLSGAIRSMDVNMAHMTPSVARVLDADILPMLDVLGLGGESIAAHDAAVWGKSTRVVIAYGPSECTVGCTINSSIPVGRGYTSIGVGVGGATWIVDANDHEKLVPVGAVGELLVEGPIVGVGYLNEEEKTKAVFIEDPSWLKARRPGRLYKTGDLVRYDPDGSGSIVFIGRADAQVKLRGQRVELGEVEHHVQRHLLTGARVAAEVLHPGGKKDDATLVAFIAEAAEAGAQCNALAESFSPAYQTALGQIEAALSQDLPRYMIPAAFLPLSVLPLLVSLKTDRKQLRALGNGLSRAQLAAFKVRQAVAVVLPETELEKSLHKLWMTTLNPADEFGRNDHFFRLGGDSLKAMKLVAAAREAGFALKVSDVFQQPTLQEQALKLTPVVDEAEEKKAVTPFSLCPHWPADDACAEVAALCNLSVPSIEDIYPCTPLQEALMALSAKVRDAYVAQRVVELPSSEIAVRLRIAFETVAADSSILRTRIVQVPRRGLMQVVLSSPPRWTEHQGSLESYLAADQEERMGLGASLARFATVTDNGKISLVFTIHHACYDGWSMPLLIDRVNQALRGVSPLPSPPPFSHFIRWLSEQDPSTPKTYWTEQLAGAVAPQFPILPRKGYQTRADSLREHYVSLPTSSSSTSIATAIRGAWALVASRYTATTDVVFGETLTGRTAPVPNIESIEGPMITTVPVRVHIDHTSTVTEYLQEIHESMVSRMPHEHLGLQNIRRLSPDAREACELRTGIVIHPTVEEENETKMDMETTPATAFVPSSEAEAAREALKFNSYALMLVFTVHPDGFLIMASFDGKTVDGEVMDGALEEFGGVIRELLESPDKKIGDVQESGKVKETVKVEGLAKMAAASLNGQEGYEGVEAAWIVDPADVDRLAPVGAVGELLVSRAEGEGLHPSWLEEGYVYRTGKWAKCSVTGEIVIVTPIESIPKSQRRAQRVITKELSPRQKTLQSFWAHILDLPAEDIALVDDFFELGGDSIRAMKLVSEARLEGLQLTVTTIFDHRKLEDMAEKLVVIQKEVAVKVPEYQPFSTLDMSESDYETLLVRLRSQSPTLTDAVIEDVYPARPLQAIAVQGTLQRPRFSVRYELFHFDAAVDLAHLTACCHELVRRNEILRTVFLSQSDDICYSVVLDSLTCPVVEYTTDGDLDAFTQQLCALDVETAISAGSPFVKFLFVQHSTTNRAVLAFRVSHAQYDEICLPILLRQLASLYDRQPASSIPIGRPFAPYVAHIHRTHSAAASYWTSLLSGSSGLTRIQPGIPTDPTNHLALFETVSISSRPKHITVASLPTAIWALLLAGRTGSRDIIFGEVVSGRNLADSDNLNADTTVGPTWQYAPIRIPFSPTWTGHDLLSFIQRQHLESARFESLGLQEIVSNCTTWNKDESAWFDSVVHQDVDHVEQLGFEGVSSRMQTVYPAMEPLREIKFQAFPNGEELGLEIVTVGSWEGLARELIDEAVGLVEVILNDEILLP